MERLGTPEISHLKKEENVVEVYEKMFKIHTTEDRKQISKTIWNITAVGYINQTLTMMLHLKIGGLQAVLTFFFHNCILWFYKIIGI